MRRHQEWESIYRLVMARAKGRCEECRKPDRESVLVTKSGAWTRDQVEGWFDHLGRSIAEPPGRKWLIFVVLTADHVNGVQGDNREENLRVRCQPCQRAHSKGFHLSPLPTPSGCNLELPLG